MAPSVNSTLPLSMNLSNQKFADVRVRRVLSLAIDRATIAKVLFDDIGWEVPMTIPWTYIIDKEPKANALGPWVKFDVA